MKLDRSPHQVIRNRIAYAVGDAGFNIYWEFASSFLLFFYTDIAHVKTTEATAILILGRLIDIFFTPVIGFLADRTHSRFGRFRPYLLWTTIPLACSFVMLFTAPSLRSAAMNAIFPGATAAITCFAAALFSILYSASNIPYTAMLSVISTEETERTRAVGLRFTCAFLGVFFIQTSTLRLAEKFGHAGAAVAWQRTAILDALLASLLLFFCFAGTREAFTPTSRSTQLGKSEIRLLLAERNLLLILAAIFLSLMAFACRSAVSVYFAHSVLHRQQGAGLFLVSGSVASFASCILLSMMPKVGPEKRRIAVLCCAVGAVCATLLAVASFGGWHFALVAQALFGFSTGMLLPVLFGMVADLPQQSAILRNHSVEGVIAALAVLFLKFGALCGGGIAGAILAAAGYIPSSVEPAAVLHALVFLLSLLPAILLLLTGAILWFPRVPVE